MPPSRWIWRHPCLRHQDLDVEHTDMHSTTKLAVNLRIINVPALKVNQIIRYSCKAVATWEFTVDPQNTIRPNIGNRDIKDNYVTAECSSLAQLRRPHVLIFPTEELFKSAWCLRDQNDDGAQLSRNNGLYVGLACLNGACTPPSCFKSWEEPVRQPALQTK